MTSPAWDHLDSGLDKDWLWADSQEDAVSSGDFAGDRGRGLPLDALLRLRRLSRMNTEIQIGPTGQQAHAAQRCLRFASPTGRPGGRGRAAPGTDRGEHRHRSRRGRRLRQRFDEWLEREQHQRVIWLAFEERASRSACSTCSCSRGCRGPAATRAGGATCANCRATATRTQQRARRQAARDVHGMRRRTRLRPGGAQPEPPVGAVLRPWRLRVRHLARSA